MSRYPALAGLRIGCVQYLNAKPLIFDYPGPVLFDHPSHLAAQMAAGALDAALVPIFEALGTRSYQLVDGVAIAARGPVYSVFLAYQGELRGVREVVLDPATLTSVHLLKVLLQEFHGLRPVYHQPGEAVPGDAARLLIGNQAIEFRQAAPPGYKFLDLGEEWQRQTGLPFAFALWLLRAALPDAASVAEEFRVRAQAGAQRLPEILAQEQPYGAALATRYLTEHIRYALGLEEKQAITLFRTLAHKHGFIPEPLPPLKYL